MPITMEDILLERERNRKERGTPAYTPPGALQDEQSRLDYIQNLIDTYEPPSTTTATPGPVAPSTADVYGEQMMREQETLRRQMVTPTPTLPSVPGPSSDAPIPVEPRDVIPTSPDAPTIFNPQGAASLTQSMMKEAYGLGEAAASVASGFVGGGLGLGHYVEQIFRDRGPKSLAQGIFDPTANVQETPPNYWKNLREQADKVAQEHTYVPRTEEGRRILGYTAPVFDAIRTFSDIAVNSTLPNMLLNDDQKEVVRYVHELLTAVALGEGVVTGVKSLRNTLGRARVKAFEDAYVGASKEPNGGPATEKLASVAEDLAVKAAESPGIREKFSEPAKTPEEINASLENIAKAKEADSGGPTTNPYKVIESEGGTYGVTREGSPSPNQSPTNFSFNTRADAEAYTGTAWNREKTLAGAPEPSPTPAIKPSKKGPPPVPDWLKENVDQIASQADTLGITDRITQLAREGKTAAQIVQEIPELQNLPPGERTTLVRAVRSRENIPSVEDMRAGETTPTAPLENPYKLIEHGRGSYEVAREGMENQAFTNKRAAERYIAREWKREQATPEAKATGDTLEEISKNPGRGAPSTKSTEDILQASEHSNAFMTRESTIAAIQKSLEDGTDISRELWQKAPNPPSGDLAVMNYENLKAIAEKGNKSSNPRGIMEIMRDIADLMMFDVPPDRLGLFGNVSISTRQKVAAKRLLADVIKNFHDTGESSKVPFAKDALDKHMEDMGINPATRLLYRDYLDSLVTPVNPPSGMGPKSMPLDGSAMTNNPVVESRITDSGLLAPRVFSNELKAFQEANKINLSSQWISGELPWRTFKKAGEDIYNMIMPHYRAAQRDIRTEINLMHKDLRKVERLVSYKEKQAITDAIEGGYPASLTGTPRRVYDILSDGVEAILARTNEVRKAIGVEPLPPIADNMEFMRAVQAYRSNGDGVNLMTIGAKDLDGIVQAHSAAPMKPTFTQKRLGLSGERDVFRQFNDFQSRASEQANLTPLTAKLREVINGSHLDVVKMDGSKFNLKSENKGLYDAVNGWLDAVDGKPASEIKAFGEKWDHVFRAFSENLGWSMLVGSVRSVMAQPFGLILTQHAAGMKNTIAAAGDALASVVGKSKNWDRMLATSDVISSRSNAPLWSGAPADMSAGAKVYTKETFKGTVEAVREGRTREAFRDVANMLLEPMEQADHVSAGISWLAFEKDGIQKGLSGEALKRYADQGVISTQASGWRGDMTPMQRNTLAKVMSQFGNVTFTEWDFMVNEVIKPARNEPLPTTALKVAKLVGIMAALDVGSVITGYDPPTPTPINDFMRSRARDDSPLTTAVKVATGIAFPYLPIFGKMTFGKGVGGPLVGTIQDFSQGLMSRPGAHNMLEPLSELGGIPASATWWRIHRLRASHPETTVLQSLLGVRPDQGSGGSLGTGLGSGLGGRMGSGLPK